MIGSRSGVPVNMLGMTLSSLASNLTVFNLAARPPSSLPSVSRARPTREARPCCESQAILLQFTRPGKGYLAAAGAIGPAPDDASTSLARERPESRSVPGPSPALLPSEYRRSPWQWSLSSSDPSIRTLGARARAAARRPIVSGRALRPRSILPSVSRATLARAASSGYVSPAASRQVGSPGSARGIHPHAGSFTSPAVPRRLSARLTVATSSPARSPRATRRLRSRTVAPLRPRSCPAALADRPASVRRRCIATLLT